MAYNKEEIYNTALDAIQKHNLFFVEDVVAFLPCSKETFYQFFPLNSDQSDNIKKLLYGNKIKTKSEIRSKLFKGKGMELIALYKILANNDELKALNGQYHDHTTKGEKIKNDEIKITFENFEDE